MRSSLMESIRAWLGVLPKPARIALIALAVLLVALAGFRITAGGPGPTARPRTTSPAGGTSLPGEGAVLLRRDGGAVLGVLRSTDGAAAAALSYVRQRNALLTGGTTARQAAAVGSKIALGGRDVGQDPASIPDRVAATAGSGMLLTRSGQLAWWTIPVGYRVRSYTEGRATVRVFSALLSVQGDPAAGPGALAFSLLDVGLAWREGAWRIRSVEATRDQPSPVLVFAVDSRSAVRDLPVRERIISSTAPSSTGLFAFLQDARPIVLGPLGMGPVAGSPALGEDAAAIVRDTAAGSVKLARRTKTLNGGRRSGWRATIALAYRPVACPTSTGDATRCFSALLVATGTERGEIATVQLGLAGYALNGHGTELTVGKLEIPLREQQRILGGQVTLTRSEKNAARTGLAAWRRSVVGLRPVVPAVPR